MPLITLECCQADIAAARAVKRAGADRIELNQRLDVGGLTPAIEVIRAVRRSVEIPVISMVRPRGGDFVYNDTEFVTLQAEVDAMIAAGADGIAFGILDASGRVDVARCRAIVAQAGAVQTVFHRAFDETADPFDAMEVIIDLGVHRILTSGQAPSAMEGAALIRRLNERADGRVEILPGAGIHAGNVKAIIETTGCTQVHGTFRGRGSGRPFDQSNMQTPHSTRPDADVDCQATDIDHVIAVRRVLDELAHQPRRT